MYEKAGVSGPSEFGKLPPGDRLFYQGWLEGEVKRAKERKEEAED